MRLHRFYVGGHIEKGKDIRIDDVAHLHQWIKVFRLKASDRVIVFNGEGSDFEGYFKVLSKREAIISIDKEKKIKNTPVCELHVLQSIIKKDNFEFVVEKCTEIGASAIHPILTERSEKKDLNLERLQKISTEAAEQSGRSSIPEIFEPESLGSAIEKFDGKMIVLDIDGDPSGIKKQFHGAGKIGILIGPEGGWTENERDLFEHKKIKSFSFGEQVLRAETAAIAASALILLK
jgi:16S rRNA (uracil1498-N3)-methyltransferase